MKISGHVKRFQKMVLFGTKNTKKINLSNKYIQENVYGSLMKRISTNTSRYLLLSGLQFSNVYKNCDNRNK